MRDLGADTEEHQLREGWGGRADYTGREVVVAEHQIFPFEAGKVDDHVGPLGWQDQDPSPLHRRIEHAPLGADVVEGRSARDVQVVEARVGAVQEPEAVLAGLHLQDREWRPVHYRRVAEELRLPLRAWVEKLTVGGEGAVLDHDRNFVVTPGDADQIRLAPRVVQVADQVEGSQARVYVQPGDRQGVIVVPERRRRLHVRIRNRLGLTPPVLLAELRLVRVAIIGARYEAAVQVCERPHARLPSGHYARIDRQEVVPREAVFVVDRSRDPSPYLDRWARVERAMTTVVVAPDGRLTQPRVQGLLSEPFKTHHGK